MIKPGLIAIHGNRLELLAETLFEWLERYPLSTLDREIILAPSHALTEWVKMKMADDWGVCAVAQVELPGRVLWGLYRKVIHQSALTGFSPTDREALVWRVMRLIAKHIELEEFSQIKTYLAQSPQTRHYELAQLIADLFDQYQVYRSDWLKAWSQGQEVLIDQLSKTTALSPDQSWQALLWRAILAELSPEQTQGIRPNLHAGVMHELNAHGSQVSSWPKRLVLFGFSSLPQQMLEFLSALSKEVQVILCINSPCQYHWGDISSGRELFVTAQHRLKNKGQILLSQVDLSEMHDHANPILANWGRQSRDFIRLLDRFDSFEASFNNFDQMRVDVFDTEEPTRGTLLESIQHQIRDLQPVAESKSAFDEAQEKGNSKSTLNDGSLIFHVAHGLTRELEILHDQLLMMMTEQWAQSMGVPRLEPKDIVVMMPDIDGAAPSIESIFGQYDKSDARFIPFGISDVVHLLNHPLVGVMKWLCQIQTQKVGLSEILEIIKIPCVAKRFGLDAQELEILESWLLESGARWGLSALHRQALGFEDCGHTNTLLFGLQRMVLGYLSGTFESQPLSNQDQGWIQPQSSVQGLEAQVVGNFAMVLECLISWWETSMTPKSSSAWVASFSQLMNQWMEPQSAQELSIHLALSSALGEFEMATQAADYDELIELEVAGQAWLEILKLPPKKQRLRASGVTFCAMKTMRSIPFKVVCLLGLNEGDFPKSNPVHPFDLMQIAEQKRAGDRSRKEDDRALMLEALLAARQTLYISWSGFGARDNAHKSPSVLVTQLRQYIRSIYGAEQLERITTAHPAQPFGRKYFDRSSEMWTFAKEWQVLHAKDGEMGRTADLQSKASAASSADLEQSLKALLGELDFEGFTSASSFRGPVALKDLIAFAKNPSKYFFRHELNINFEDIEANLPDSEPMSLGGLDLYGIKDELLRCGIELNAKNGDLELLFDQKTRQLRAEGRLSMGAMGDEMMKEVLGALHEPVRQYLEIAQDPKHALKRVDLNWRDAKEREIAKDIIQVHVPGSAQSTPMVLKLSASRLFAQKKIKLEHLLAPWLTCAYMAACGFEASVKWIFSDAMLISPSMDPNAARAVLCKMLGLFTAGQGQVMPVPFKTASAFALEGSLDKARMAYEGAQFNGGGDFADLKDLCWAREYPNFDALVASPSVTALWKVLYSPLVQWSQKDIVVEAFGQHGD